VTKRGKILVLAAPSGAGKRTLVLALRDRGHALATPVSMTTRAPRDGERDGVDYHFVTREEFERRRTADEFVEWAEVHGNLYGTLRDELERGMNRGEIVLLELDVQGVRNLKQDSTDLVSVFIMPPSIEELERRLRARGANDPDDLAVRLINAKAEIAAQHEFDHVIVNDRVESAVDRLERIIQEMK